MIRNLLILLAATAPTFAQGYDWRDTLDAIRQVETGGCANEGRGAKGDNGNALGPYQIWRIYHTDAAERDKALTDYKRCLNDKAYSERVVRAYMLRYCREQMRRLDAGTATLADVERVARVHNGGPRGHTKKATVRYWNKVKKELND